VEPLSCGFSGEVAEAERIEATCHRIAHTRGVHVRVTIWIAR